MDSLADLELTLQALSTDEKQELVRFLLTDLARKGVRMDGLQPPSHSVLDIPPVNLGAMLVAADSGDDLLGEMLEERP